MITNTKTDKGDLPDYLFEKVVLDFETLRKQVIKQKFKNKRDYWKNKKIHWPLHPQKVYKEKWKNWYYFLGKEKISFETLRKEVIRCNFKSMRDYIRNKKPYWPTNPHTVYKDEGWKNWYYFLGTKDKWMSYKDLKKEVIKCKFSSMREYYKNRKSNWPVAPYKVYKNKGWKNSIDFLGKQI